MSVELGELLILFSIITDATKVVRLALIQGLLPLTARFMRVSDHAFGVELHIHGAGRVTSVVPPS